MKQEIETTEIYKTALETIRQFYNVGTEKDLLARYVAEDISLAVTAVFGTGNEAKYLLDAISNKVQSWCNPELDEDEDEDEDDDPLAKYSETYRAGIRYMLSQLDEDDKAIIRAECNQALGQHLIPDSNIVDDSKITDLLEEYGADEELPEGWYLEEYDASEILMMI